MALSDKSVEVQNNANFRELNYKVELVAKRDIEPYEEIYADYIYNLSGNLVKSFAYPASFVEL